jgi:pentatricopeptide repeat protein
LEIFWSGSVRGQDGVSVSYFLFLCATSNREARVRLLKAYTTMGAVLARHGREGEIESLVEEMKASGLHPDVFFYNAIARGYGNQGLVLPASRLLLQMEKHGVQPNNTTYERVSF